MSKKRLKKGIASIEKQILLHKEIKLKEAREQRNFELERYYERELTRLEGQKQEKSKKLKK